MYKEIRLIRFNNTKDKIYIFFKHSYYYNLFKIAPIKLIKNNNPQVLNIAFKDKDMSMLLVIKKDTFKPIYDYFEMLEDKIKELEKLSYNDLKIATKLGTTDKNTINKIKQFRKMVKGSAKKSGDFKNEDDFNEKFNNKVIYLKDFINKLDI